MCWSHHPYLYCGCRFISNECSRLYFSHYFWILCWKSLTSEHKIEFLRLTVEELQALLAKGLIFLIIFGFFVANPVSTTYNLKVIIFAGNRPYFSHYFRILCWKSLTSKQKIQFPWLTVWALLSMQATGLIFLIIFSFFVEKHKIQFPHGFRVLCLIHSCEVITHCRVKQVYPLKKLHLWCPRLK